jgi:hypothetical protein
LRNIAKPLLNIEAMKSKIIISSVILGVAIIAATGYMRFTGSHSEPNQVNSGGMQLSRGGSGSIDEHINDDRYLVGWSHYIFVGKVLRQTGTGIMVGPQSSAQYAVEVISNIKGELTGTVTVAQMGAWLTNTGEPSFFFDDDGYLHVGATYLFATKYKQDANLYEIATPGYDRKLLTDDASLSTDQLSALADSNSKVQSFKEAYPNEVLYYWDMKTGTAWNNYESLKSGHLLTPPAFVPQVTNTAATPVAESTSPEPSPSVSESVVPSVSAEPEITPAESPIEGSPAPKPSPTEVPVES